MTPTVRTGAQRAVDDVHLLGDGPIGLLTNFTGTLPDLRRTSAALVEAGAPVTALFSPEHGLNGSAQAGASDTVARDADTGLPVLDTYLRSGAALDDLLIGSGVATLVFDMQDIGVRYYTYVWTMFDAMEGAARTGIRFVVLDRPNPLGGIVVEGRGLDPRFSSFVGRADVRQRHGLTAGELARFVASRDLAERGLTIDLEVIEVEGWDGGLDAGMPWVPPSPNIPTVDSALAFAGTGLIEGTNVSEGRGTTRPFETIGAPFVDARFAAALRAADLPGVLFREVWFAPTFHKYAGQTVRGVQLHIVDRHEFRPVDTALFMIDTLAELYPRDFRFLPPGERLDGPDRRHAIDLLWGSDSLRRTVERGDSARSLPGPPAAVLDVYGAEELLYPRARRP